MKNILLKDKEPMYRWSKEGIIMMRGELKGKNLTELSKTEDNLLEYLEMIIDKTDDKYIEEHDNEKNKDVHSGDE